MSSIKLLLEDISNRGCNDEFEARAIGVLKVKVSLIYSDQGYKIDINCLGTFCTLTSPALVSPSPKSTIEEHPQIYDWFSLPRPHTDCMPILAMQVVRGVT
jgi:hypothetical protein